MVDSGFMLIRGVSHKFGLSDLLLDAVLSVAVVIGYVDNDDVVSDTSKADNALRCHRVGRAYVMHLAINMSDDKSSCPFMIIVIVCDVSGNAAGLLGGTPLHAPFG